VGRNPEDIIELLNAHMSAMTAVVQAHRGVINQFAGDAIMALFGAPRSYGDDAVRAVQCAVAMLAERERLNAIVHEPIRVGIGLASGEMVAGCIGAENRNDYTVVGERVNLAARLCSTAKAGEILIDDATRERMGDRFESVTMAPLTLKGFAEAMPAYRIVRPAGVGAP
jgi:class 3 adenylate cyclase